MITLVTRLLTMRKNFSRISAALQVVTGRVDVLMVDLIHLLRASNNTCQTDPVWVTE